MLMMFSASYLKRSGVPNKSTYFVLAMEEPAPTFKQLFEECASQPVDELKNEDAIDGREKDSEESGSDDAFDIRL